MPGANVDREIIERIPKGRDFTSVVTSAPGITDDQFHGDVGFYTTNDRLYGDVGPTLRLSPTNQNVAEFVTTPPATSPRGNPVADLGGPILRDRLWCFAGYNSPVTATRRTVTFLDNGQTATFENKPIDRIVNWNVSSISVCVEVRFTF